MLERFLQLKEVNFQSQNHTWDSVVEEIPNSEGKVYTEPRLLTASNDFQLQKKMCKEIKNMPNQTILLNKDLIE